MKKLLTGLLALLTCFTCATAVACGDNGNKDNSNSNSNSESPDVEDELQDAVDYLEALYKDKNAETRQDYDVLASIMGYPITWSVDVASGVTIVEKDATNYTVQVATDLSEDLTYVLTATVADGDRTLSVSFTRKFNSFKNVTYT